MGIKKALLLCSDGRELVSAALCTYFVTPISEMIRS